MRIARGYLDTETGCDTSRGRTGRIAKTLSIAGALAISAAVSGCGLLLPDRIHYEWQPEAQSTCSTCAAGTDPIAVNLDGNPSDRMIGLALSGGGSRAAVFAAAILAALAEQGLTERITHISSVSGGGFAASYFAINPQPAACAEPGQQGAACRSAYFAAFDQAMREDFTTATLLNQLASPGRITSPTRRATSLQEALDAGFLNGATFGDLPGRPILLFNAARYDDGRRFVFSTLTLDEDRPDYAPLTQDALRSSSFSLADCPQPTPPDLPLSLAVVASAAFPPVFGPITVQAQRSCADPTRQYWHLGDGGIVENTGADALRELAARGAHNGTLTSALFLIADASAPHGTQRSFDSADLSIFTSNPGAVVDVAQLRGAAFADLFWERERETIGIPFDTIVFRFNESEIAAWPDSCAAESQANESINAYLSTVPTGLDIGACDADLLAAAAGDLVRRRLAESVSILQQHGLTTPADSVALLQ